MKFTLFQDSPSVIGESELDDSAPASTGPRQMSGSATSGQRSQSSRFGGRFGESFVARNKIAAQVNNYFWLYMHIVENQLTFLHAIVLYEVQFLLNQKPNTLLINLIFISLS